MKTVKRPTILTVLCIASFLLSIISFPAIFSPFIKKKGDFIPALSGILISMEFIATVGIWYMKKWAVFFYLVTFLLSQSLWLSIDNWAVWRFIFSLIFLIFIAVSYKKMDDNL